MPRDPVGSKGDPGRLDGYRGCSLRDRRTAGGDPTVGAIEGFGILSMASVGPIIAVLSTGLWVQRKVRRRHASQDAVADEAAAREAA